MKPEPTEPNVPTRRPHAGLERDKVAAAALELLNEVGFDGLTLRRLADKLGVKAAALYWHFKNKQDLIDLLATKILEDEFVGGINEAAFKDCTWRQALEGMGRRMRDVLRRYRDGAMIIASADFTGANANGAGSKSAQGRDMMFAKLLDEGFTSDLAFSALFSVGRFTIGCVFEEQADPRTKQPRDKTPQEIIDEMCDRPMVRKVIDEVGFENVFNPDRQFEAGLALLLDGIAYRLSQPLTTQNKKA